MVVNPCIVHKKAGSLHIAGAGRAERNRAGARPRSEPRRHSPHAGLDAAEPDPALAWIPPTPQIAALPGGVTPAYGQRSLSEGEWRFDFHGFLTAPLVVGIGSRPMPTPDQSGTTLHTPPAVPDDLETFSHTGVVPTTYAQLNFSQGTSLVSANMSILARQANASTSFLEPASQLGVTDLYVSILPKLERARTEIFVGAFTSRYGSPGEYDEGRYGTPLIARINGVGERVSAARAVRQLDADGRRRAGRAVEQGEHRHDARRVERLREPERGDQLRRARPRRRARYRTLATLGLHYPRLEPGRPRPTTSSTASVIDASQPDAKLDIFAADLRVTAGRFGHLYWRGVVHQREATSRR